MKLLYLHFLYGEDTALNHVGQFAGAARGLGHEVEIASMNLANAASSDDGPHGNRGGVREVLKKSLGRYLHEPKELMWNRRYARLIAEHIRRVEPDVVLARDEVLNYSFVKAADETGVPLAVEVNAPALEARLFLDQYWHVPMAADRIEGWKLRRADQVTVVSGALRDHLVERHGLESTKFTVVPNGADVQVFHPRVARAPEMDRLSADVVVGFVGSFQKWHGTDLLAGMALEVGRDHSDVSFLFVGDGPEMGELKRSLSPLGERVVLTGRKPHSEVPGLVSCFDIGVVAQAAFYMSPLKVLEWMAAGKAVVAPAYGPLRELMDDGVHGLLFEPEDQDALVAAVSRLVEDRQLREQLGHAAERRVRENLTWADNARKVLEACSRAREAGGKAA